jgi:hypothetical protein
MSSAKLPTPNSAAMMPAVSILLVFDILTTGYATGSTAVPVRTETVASTAFPPRGPSFLNEFYGDATPTNSADLSTVETMAAIIDRVVQVPK